MKKLIEIENITVKYKNKIVFENISWDITENTFVTLLGKSGVGKTTLIKAILEIINYEGNIKNNDEKLNTIELVSENPNINVIGETVTEELKISLKKSNYTEEEKQEKITKIISEFKLEKIKDKITTNLSGGEKQIVSFIKIILKNPKILILDNCFSMVDRVKKEKIIKYIKKYKQDKKSTIIYISNDTNDVLYGNLFAILTNNELISGTVEDIIKLEKIFKQNKLEFPFMVDLSNKLKYYDLMDKPIYEIDKMVDHLWK